MNSFLMAVSGEGMVRSLMVLLIVGICALAIWAAGKWVITSVFKAPPIALTVWNGIFVILGLIVLINFLLGLIGYPLIKL